MSVSNERQRSRKERKEEIRNERQLNVRLESGEKKDEKGKRKEEWKGELVSIPERATRLLRQDRAAVAGMDHHTAA